jgi:hypothetical protein
MAASAWRVYNEAKKYLLGADLDINAALMRIKLVKGGGASTVSNYTVSTFASAGSGNAVANIKTPHPKSLTGITLSTGVSAKETKFDATNAVFSASGGTMASIQYAVIGISGGKALCWCKLSTAAFDVTTGNTLTVQFNALGILTLTGGVT